LGRALIQMDGVELNPVERQPNLSIREKGGHPVTEGRREAAVAEDMDNMLNINVIEEALYVEEDNRGDEPAFDSGLGIVSKAKGSIGG